MRNAINLSSSWYKLSSGGLFGHFIPLATDSFGILLSFNEFKQVWQTHSSSLTDVNFVQYNLLICVGMWMFFSMETIFLNQVWWQNVHTYNGPTEILEWNSMIQSSIVLNLFWQDLYDLWLCNGSSTFLLLWLFISFISVSAVSFVATLFFHIPIQKVFSLHFVSICAGILPHLIEMMDLVSMCLIAHSVALNEGSCLARFTLISYLICFKSWNLFCSSFWFNLVAYLIALKAGSCLSFCLTAHSFALNEWFYLALCFDWPW